MISLIICSRSSQNLAAVSISIEQTIGAPYEIIAINNSLGHYGICEAYNIGAKKAKFDILCFMHEDIYFHTADWGKKVVSLFQDKTIGVLGVAGSTYLPVAPCAWWESGENNIRANILHTAGEEKNKHMYYNPNYESLSDVVVVDGVWMCTKKQIWERHPFDQRNFSEFHFYDIDFCTQIGKKARVCISFDILIEHYSYGSVNNSWTKNALKYYAKTNHMLPLGNTSYSDLEINDINTKGYVSFIYRLKQLGVNRKTVAKYVIKLFMLSPFRKGSLYHLKALLRNS